MLVAINRDDQVLGVVLVVRGGWVSVFSGCICGGHPLASFPGDGLGDGEILGA